MKPVYPPEPGQTQAYTARNDRAYTRFALVYDRAVRWFPLWQRWLQHALPYVRGPRVLEVSFGTGYLLGRYAGRVEAYGIDYNARLIALTQQKLRRSRLHACLQRADVAALPYRDAAFDTVVNTMALSGYPDGRSALAELQRVLKPGGRLVLIDVGYPRNRNFAGTFLARTWVSLGDIIRELGPLLSAAGFDYSQREIGGWGSVHLYLATKQVENVGRRPARSPDKINQPTLSHTLKDRP